MPTNAAWPIRFGTPATRPMYDVTVQFGSSVTTAVELLRDGGTREPWNPADGDWKLRLPTGLYAVCLPGSPTPVPGGLFAVTEGPVDVHV
jgi:hypothetical protein